MIEELAYPKVTMVSSLDGSTDAGTGRTDQQAGGRRLLPGAGVGGGSIRRKLLVSHLKVAAVGFAMLLVALASMELLRSNVARLAQERGPVVNASLQALGGVQRSVAELSGWVAFGDDLFKERREATWVHEIAPAVDELRRASWLWDDLTVGRLQELDAMLSELQEVQRKVETVAHASEGGASREDVEGLMASQVVPRGRRVVGFLRGISSGQVALMRVDAASVSLISRIGMVLSVLLIVGMGAFAWVASERGSEEITRPIQRLMEATEALAGGRLTEDIPVTEDDEIGRLTVAFNLMRASLAKATDSIRQTANQLTDATVQIMAATTQQAKGTREQTAAIRSTVETVAEITRAAETVVARARGVSDSVESAAVATAAGRHALEAWLGGAVALQARFDDVIKTQNQKANGAGEILNRLQSHMHEVQEAMEKLVQLLTEAEKMASETGHTVSAQAARLAETQVAMQHVDALAGQTFDRTVQVEHVAQHLKARSRQLREVLGTCAMYVPPPDDAQGN